MSHPLSLHVFLLTAQRTHLAIESAMDAAFSAAIIRITLSRGEDAPLDESVKYVFELAFAEIVVPTIEAIAGGMAEGSDLQVAILGQVKGETEKANHDWFMGRVEDLIANSQANALDQERRQAAPKN